MPDQLTKPEEERVMRTIDRTGTSSGRRVGKIRIAAAAAAVVAGTMASGAYAQTVVHWLGTTGDYQNGLNWDSNTPPANASNEILLINNGGTAQVSAGGEGAFLYLGLTTGDTGSLQITGGTLTLGELRVGGRYNNPLLDPITPPANAGGVGSVLQTGGTLSVTYSTGTEPPVQSLYIADAGLDTGNTAVGSYTIKNNAVLIAGIANNDQIVVGTGSGAQGTFLQQDTSSVTSTGHLIVARQGATASYTLTGGTLQVGDPNLSSGSMNLQIGDGANLAGTAIAATPTVGTFTQSGASTVNVRATLEVGRRGGTATYNMTGGTLNISSQVAIGTNGGATSGAMLSSDGTLNLSGGDISVATNFNVGLSSNSVANTGHGQLNITGGTLTLKAANSILAIGNGVGTTGQVNHSGGTLTMTGSTANIDIGRNNGGDSSYTLSGTGRLDATTISLSSNGSNTHAFTITGGTLNAGTVTFGTIANATSTRIFTVSGGTSRIGTLNLGATSNSFGQFIYNGGDLRIDSLSLATTSKTTINANIDFRNRADTAGSSVAFGNSEINVAPGVTATFSGALSNNGRSPVKTGDGTLILSGPFTNSTNSIFTVNAGALDLNSSVNGNLTFNANSTTHFNASQTLAALNVGDSATATLAAGGTRTLTTNALNLNSTGTLDLTDNAMTLNYTSSPLSTVVAKLLTAYNGGTWTGAGLTSTTARDRSDHAKGLGYFDNGTQVLVQYTWMGDLNLNGVIDADDYTLIDRQIAINSFGAPGQWKDGDVNYDGVVDTADYLVIDTAFGHQNGIFSPGFLAEREAQFGKDYVTQLTAAVPEPGVGGLVLAAIAGLGRRRKTGHHAPTK